MSERERSAVWYRGRGPGPESIAPSKPTSRPLGDQLLGDFEGDGRAERKTCDVIRALGLDSTDLFDVIGGQRLDVGERFENAVFLGKRQAVDWSIGTQMVDQRAPAQVIARRGSEQGRGAAGRGSPLRITRVRGRGFKSGASSRTAAISATV